MNSLDNSQFEGCNDLQSINLQGLYFDGLPLPPVWGTLPNLVDLFIYDCDIGGTLNNLIGIHPEQMWIDFNPLLSGTIPTEFGGSDNIQVLSYSFTENSLYGTIPTEFGDLLNLESFWVYRNYLNGAVPSEMAQLGRLKIFRTEENNLTGSMPSEICDISYKYKVLGSKCMHLGNNICACCNCCDAYACNALDDTFY